MAFEMTYWYKEIFSLTGVLFFSINIDAILVYCVVKTGELKVSTISKKVDKH